MKEGKSRCIGAFWIAAVGGVLITAAVIALYTPWLRVFDLREIAVVGNQRVSAREVVRVAGLHRNQTLPSISVGNVADRIAALADVRDVDVRRIFPHRIQILIQERAFVARVLLADEAQCLTLGEGGVVIDPSCDGGAALPLLIGASVSGSEVGSRLLDDRVTALIDSLRRIPVEMRITQVDVADVASVVLEAGPGLRILLGSIGEASSKLDSLVALCRTIELADYELIDLRVEGEATLAPR